ncbi:MAG: hypothetical protein D6734_09730, partial [Candidatus Schekmanbacteria bacterium]
KICRRIKSKEIITDKDKCLFIVKDSEYLNINKLVKSLDLQKNEIVILLKSNQSIIKNNSADGGLSNISTENFNSFAELLKKLRDYRDNILFLPYSGTINESNLTTEVCAFASNMRKIVGIDDSVSEYELNSIFLLYKICWSLSKLFLLLLSSLILLPFVTLFLTIMVVLMVLNSNSSKKV